MSQKSSVPQAVSFVSQVLKRDMRIATSMRESGEALVDKYTVLQVSMV